MSSGGHSDRAAVRNGWWPAHRYLVLRRLVQGLVAVMFMTGPLFGIWIAKGTLASSLFFDVLPLSDPFILVQSIVARHLPATTALLGAALVVASYLLLGGRSYCGWVCPINAVTDLAAWLRQKLGIDKGSSIRTELRYWILGMVLLVSAATGAIAWEFVNPITILWRALVLGPGLAVALVGVIFLFDLLAVRRGWCGHLCPVGAFYALLGRAAVLRVTARGRTRCDDCLDCYAVCPEGHVIAPALRALDGHGPVITSGDCSLCGRCIDVCSEGVFTLTHRWDDRVDPLPGRKADGLSPAPALPKSEMEGFHA